MLRLLPWKVVSGSTKKASVMASEESPCDCSAAERSVEQHHMLALCCISKLDCTVLRLSIAAYWPSAYKVKLELIFWGSLDHCYWLKASKFHGMKLQMILNFLHVLTDALNFDICCMSIAFNLNVRSHLPSQKEAWVSNLSI